MTNQPDEDLIEATIRRVAAASAARQPGALEDDAEDAAEHAGSAPDLHVVRGLDDEEPEAAPIRAPADESLIEATLRRIEAQQAERAAEAAHPPAADSHGSTISEPSADAALGPDIHLLHTADERMIGPAAIAALRRDLDDARRQLHELTERVNSLSASWQGPASPSQGTTPETNQAPTLASADVDDDWDDAPVVARIDTGLPPRPAIVRDHASVLARTEIPEDSAPSAPEPLPAPLPPAPPADARRGLELLPRTYRITVEDKRRGVDLVPLHRALLGMEGVRDMSLLSYSNGTAIVALEATTELSPDGLGAAVAHAMAREVKVEVHNEQTMVIKLAED